MNQDKLILKFKPTVPKIEKDKKYQRAIKKTKDFVEDIETTQDVPLNQETIAILKEKGTLPGDLTGPEITSALHLAKRGVNTKNFIDVIEKRRLPEEVKEQLYVVADTTEVLYEGLGLEEELQILNQEPQITFTYAPPQYQTPRSNEFLLEFKDNVLNPVFDKGVSRIEGKAKKFTSKKLEKTLVKGSKKLKRKAGKAVGRVGKKVAGKVAKKGIGKTVGTVVTGLVAETGPLAPVIGAIAGFITEKILIPIYKAIKRLAKYIAALGAVLLGLGVLATSPLLIIGGTGMLAVGGITGGAAAITGIVAALPVMVATGFAGFATALIVAIVVVPVLIAFIIFVITTGAYVTPGQGGIFSVPTPQSRYIKITKTPNPSGPFANDQNQTITYTIIIEAQEFALTNISFDASCDVSSESGVTCPAVDNVLANGVAANSFPPTPPQIINPGSPFVITYEQLFLAPDYNDSLVTDTFTVTADASDQIGVRSSASATVIFGNPPTACLYLTGANWPANESARVQSAILHLVSHHSTYLARACAGGDIPLCFGPTCGPWGCHNHTPACDITLNAGGLTNSADAIYILTHEIGHHLDTIDSSYFRMYVDSGATAELPLCSYTATGVYDSEGFAEGIALYASLPSFWVTRCGEFTYQSKYPLHWQFVSDNIFN